MTKLPEDLYIKKVDDFLTRQRLLNNSYFVG